MSTKTNVKIFNLISSLVRVLYRMKKRSVRTFDKYIISLKISMCTSKRSAHKLSLF